jgi:hypothetical protein
MTRKLQTEGQRRSKMKEMGKSIIEAMSANLDRLTVNVTAASACGSKGKIRVAVVASSEVTKSDILTSINEKFNGKLRAVARSFRIVETANSDRNNVQVQLEGYVVPNVEIIALSSEQGSRMKCVASNMFLDAGDCIWSKTGDFLYKKSDVETAEELNQFLTECASSTVRMRKTVGFEQVVVASGDFISYMSKGEMCYGFVVASDESNGKLMVLAEGEEDPEVIDTFDVQDQAVINDDQVRFPEEEEMVETSATSVDVNALVNYYKRWFAYNPKYAQTLIDRLKSHSFC